MLSVTHRLETYDGIICWKTNSGMAIGPSVPFICEDYVRNEVPGYDPTTGIFTAPWDCEVEVTANCYGGASTALGQNIDLIIVDGVGNALFGSGFVGPGSTFTCHVNGLLRLKYGDAIQVRIYSSVAGNLWGDVFFNFIILKVKKVLASSWQD
jgi:hypothetical protein